MLKTYMYPIVTYEVDMSYFHVFSNYKVRLGDTIYISDPNFLDGLLFQARVSEYKKNPSDTTQNTITLTNAVRIIPKINEALKKRMEELAAMMAPYTMTLKTDNGITFKDMSSESTITPSLFKGTDEYTNVDFMYFQNETFLGEGDTYTVRANSMGDGTQTITAKAYVSGEPVVSQQITFAHVLGIANTVITYGLSMSDTTEPATWSSERPALVNGMYLWTRTVLIYTNGSSTTSYQITYIAKDADATAAIDKTKQELTEKLETVEGKIPTSAGGRNLALGTSADWSAGLTQFNGQNNQTTAIYRVYNRGFKIGDKVNIRLVLKYSDIVAAEGQRAEVKTQFRGNVTEWGKGQLPGDQFWVDKSDGEIELKGKKVVDEYMLKNEYWEWRLRVDYVKSGKIQWKEAKAEVGDLPTPWSLAPEDTVSQISNLSSEIKQTADGMTLLATKTELNNAKAEIDEAKQDLTAVQNKLLDLISQLHAQGVLPGEI